MVTSFDMSLSSSERKQLSVGDVNVSVPSDCPSFAPQCEELMHVATDCGNENIEIPALRDCSSLSDHLSN